MMNRRQFIQRGSLALAGTALAARSLATPRSKYEIGIQLYTLRDVMPKDPKGNLRMLANLGYKHLETYGYNKGMLFGMPSKEFHAYVKGLGMQATSGHYGLGKASDDGSDWEKAVTDAKEAGQDFMGFGSIPDDARVSIDAYKAACDLMNKRGEICKKYGIRLNYHNHDFEFVKINGQVPYDVMLSRLDPKLVGMEMDIYWIVYAGADPLAYFAKYPGRFEQWHIKDMDKADRKKNTDIGTGSIDFKKIIAKADQAGLKHWYMEQEEYPISSTESVKASIGYLKTL